MKKRICTLLLVFCLAASLAAPALAAEGGGLTPIESSNRSRHSYGNWSKPVTSYLVPTGEGYLRVEKVGSGGQMALAERYDANFQLLSQQYLPEELPIWGGFFAGENHYFAVFGQKNPDEDDSLETMRIVKYDKDLNRVGAAAYTANNTTVPFDAGTLRMAECDGMLYIRTCHEMYKSKDGLNHQANVTLAVRESDMTITDEFSKVMNVGYGYVSHSFNQFIAVSKDKTLVALDHGDAYPRSAVLMTYAPKAGEEKILRGVTYTNLLTFKGRTGDNATGAQLGGLALTDEYALVAGVSKDQAETATDTTKNLFLATAPLANIKENNTLTWLTHYTAEDKVQVNNPHLVAVEDGAWLLWEETNLGAGAPNTLYVQRLDAKGVPAGEAAALAGSLSDCVPIYRDGKLVWYAGNFSAPRFYTLDTETMTLEHHIPGDPTLTDSVKVQDIRVTFGDESDWATYKDVKSTDWYAAAVRLNYQAGFLKGSGESSFDPAGTVSVAQAVTMACRVHAAFHYDEYSVFYLPTTDPWYQSALDYADIFGIAYPQNSAERLCSREEFVSILAAAVPQAALAAIHEGDPFQGDVFQTEATRAAALSFYQAGVINGVTGPDGSITFDPQGTLTRAQAAAILARLIRTEQRV